MRKLFTAGMMFTGALVAACSSGDAVGSGADNVTSAPAASTLSRSYQGTIKDLKVYFHLDQNGIEVTGTYFYEGKATQGEVIDLQGKLEGSKLTLDESVAGKKTGTLVGTLAGTKVTGTWKKPDGSGSLPLALDAIPSGTLVAVKRLIQQSAKASQPGGDGAPGKCELKAEYFDVFGLASADAEAKIDKALAVKPLAAGCDFPFSSEIKQEIKLNASGLLVVNTTEDDTGGAHPETSMTTKNFSIKLGTDLTPSLIFRTEALQKIGSILKDAAQSDTSLSADEKQTIVAQIDGVTKLDSYNVEVRKEGINVDLFNHFPHVILGLAPERLFTWAEIRDLLLPGTDVSALAH
jgi:hypothetical protein